MSKILFVSPHPDDETLGCGGTILRAKKDGHELFWSIITEPSEKLDWPQKQIEARQLEIKNVAKEYSFNKVFNLKMPAVMIDTLSMSQIIEKIVSIYKEIEPEIIYIPFLYDVHTDHQIISKAFQSTSKWFRSSHIKKILMYETLSETEFNFAEKRSFNPNVFVDISGHLDKKIEIMNIYKSEVADFPFPRSEKAIRALAALRGSQSGFEAAESFELVLDRK
jgi:LmbE family N-acetylglucosaminyl deacetylase